MAELVSARDLPRDLVGIQILRGIAATLVVWHHALEEAQYVVYRGAPPDWLIRFGAAGVDIFFVISGFIMMYVNFAPGRTCQPVRSFLARRALRIYPLYWACCAAALSLKALGFFRSVSTEPAFIVNSLLLLPLHETYLIGVAWTLVYEMYFYLLFAASLAFANARGSLLITISLLSAAYLSSHGVPFPSLRAFLSSECVFEFGLGLLVGYVVTQRRLPRATQLLFIPGLLALIALSARIVAPSTNEPASDVQRFFVWGLPATLIVLSAVYWTPASNTLSRWGRLLGDASFAVYLTHGFVMVSYAVILRNVPAVAAMSQWPVTCCVVAICLIVGLVAHRTVERAANRLAHSAAATISRSVRGLTALRSESSAESTDP